MARGIPTILLSPTITTLFCLKSMPLRFNSSMQPRAVHGTNRAVRPRMSVRPTFSGWKPSTSFRGSKCSMTSSSSMWGGRGSWTSTPSIISSSHIDCTACRMVACEHVSSMYLTLDNMPMLSHASRFRSTYTWLSGRSPTRTTPSPGGRPAAATISFTSFAISCCHSKAHRLPSKSLVATVDSARRYPPEGELDVGARSKAKATEPSIARRTAPSVAISSSTRLLLLLFFSW